MQDRQNGGVVEVQTDKAAALVQRWMKPLYGFALNRTGRMDEAEELAGRMVEGLYRSLLRHGIPDHPPSYVWRLASNHWARWLRDRSREPGQASFDEAVHSSPEAIDPAGDMIREETLGLLRREVAWLSCIQRQVVIRHYFESQPLARIARDLAMPVGTLKWHLSAAREELRKGMEIMRTVGELGMKPVEFKGGVWLSGDPGREQVLTQLNRRLCQNIVYSCYHQDRTLEEIATELGVSPVFLADEVQSLEAAGILERHKVGRFLAEILIMEWKRPLIQSLTTLYRDHAPGLAERIFSLLDGMEAEFATSGITWPGQNWNTLLWTLIPLCICKKIPRDDSGPGPEAFWIERPDGGKYCLETRLEPDFEPGEDRGFLENRYYANGPMEFDPWIDSTPPPLDWHAWRLDNAWNQRKCKPWGRMKDEYSWLARHIHGDLSPDFNPDEYRALVENGWLEATGDGSFTLKVVHVPAPGPAADNCPMTRLLPQPEEETLKAFSAFSKAWLDLVLPTIPARLRPLATALYKDNATGHRMMGYILEHLEQTGRLKTPTQAERPGLQMVMWV